MDAHNEDKSTDSTPGSSTTNLIVPCVVQSADDDSSDPSLRLSGHNAPKSNEGLLSVSFSDQSDNYERSTGISSIALPRTEHSAEDSKTSAQHIFTKNSRPPVVDFKPPKVGERLVSILQLVTCLGLLQEAHSPDDVQDSAARQWYEDTAANADEQERLKKLAMDVVRAFKSDELKDAKVVAEVVYLAPVLDKDIFRELLNEFYDGIGRSGLLDFYQLDGFAQLIQGANAGYLDADDLVKIQGLLSKRLNDLLQQSPAHVYHFTLAASHVLDAMADAKIRGLDLEKLHKLSRPTHHSRPVSFVQAIKSTFRSTADTTNESLPPYLDLLKESSDPHLVYQAAYVYQALRCFTDDETLWQTAFQRTGKAIQGVSGHMSAVKGPDLNGFIDVLKDIQQEISEASEDIQLIAPFVETLKEGPSFNRKTAWYPALRGTDVLIREGQFVSFKKLVDEVPCRMDPAFQWGVCQRLGEIAANRSWDLDTRGSAIAFLGEIYRNDAEWGQEVSIKQWILNILVQLSSLSENEMQAKTLLEDLRTDGDAKKQGLCRASMDIDPSSYPLKVASSIPASSILLDRVQESRKRILTEGDTVYSCAYSPNGKLLAVGLRNRKISVYKTSNWERIQTLNGHTDEVNSVAFSPTSDLVASASDDRTVRLWDVETGSMLRTLTGHTSAVYCIAYSPRGNQVASGGNDNTVKIWDANTGSCLRTLSGHRNSVMCVAYSPDGKQIASGGFDRTVRMWDVETRECVLALQGHGDTIRGVAYSPQGNRIASGSEDERVRVWDTETGECLSILVRYNAWSVAFSPKGYALACGGADGTMKLWDIESESCSTLTGHSSTVRSIIYSPGGNQIASGSDDRTVRLWDI
ncbi:MAG: WD40-repeat-containing domain protein [Benniella sp.]|nr:MAG: WD40-repeat-containing domain protein [Benniella sp.]